jgi:D-sedoheptulose 7-phosphate isomerase
MQSEIERYLDRVAALIIATPREPIYRFAQHLHTRWQLGATIITAGNGGSAATASHFAGDVTKATRHNRRKPVRALCLNDNMTACTAWANDTSYSHALAEQLKSLGRAGDVFVPISGSGNSANIIQAAIAAKQQQMLILALTGSGGGELAELADVAVIVPSEEMPAIEDVHLAICHVLINELRAAVAR